MNISLEGRIDITLLRHAGATPEVRLASTRQQLAQRLLAGLAPDRAAEMVGLVFTLCGRAQRAAAEIAGEAAQGQTPSAELHKVREYRVLAELAQEHVWRLLLDWPKQCGQPPATQVLQALRAVVGEPAAFIAALEAALTGPFLAEPVAGWLDRVSGPDGLAQFDAWCQAGAGPVAGLFAGLGKGVDWGMAQVPFLPAVHGLEQNTVLAIARQALAQPTFCASPRLQQRPAETGALARGQDEPLLAAWLAERGGGVGARMLARLLELARLPDRLRQPGPVVAKSWNGGAGIGVAAVDTSRGLLLHVLQLDAGRIVQYRILAPTEWNFQPGGPLQAALAGLPNQANLDALARQVVLSLDPCVDYAVEVVDA